MADRRVHRPRVIPVLLLHANGLLYKTVKFGSPKYVGDPRIAVKIFNDKGADEIAILDITATTERREPNYALIEEIASEAFMPLAYGGGIRTAAQAKRILGLGAEKVIINSHAVERPSFLGELAAMIGSQSVVASIDVKRDLFGRYRVMTAGGKRKTGLDPVQCAKELAKAGAGEILLSSIDRDGTFQGYDLELTRSVARAVDVPLIASGGAGSVRDLGMVIKQGGASAAAAGSIFVFQGPHKAVLITFPEDDVLRNVFG